MDVLHVYISVSLIYGIIQAHNSASVPGVALALAVELDVRFCRLIALAVQQAHNCCPVLYYCK